jgi:hypothetical protein
VKIYLKFVYLLNFDAPPPKTPKLIVDAVRPKSAGYGTSPDLDGNQGTKNETLCQRFHDMNVSRYVFVFVRT